MLQEITHELNNEEKGRERAMSRSYQPRCSSTESQNLNIATIEIGGNRQGKKKQQTLTSKSLAQQLTADKVNRKSENEQGKSNKFSGDI